MGVGAAGQGGMSTTTEFADLAEQYGDELHCRQNEDPGAWFAEPGSKRQERAKVACAGCPLIEQCRAYALNTGIPDGVWGGLSESDRKLIWTRGSGKPTHFLDEIDAALAPARIAQEEAA